ncbi:MAG TPA: TIGR03067 domain-containing protein [Steroidobacteraceae bacterium]|nr:TIGR03067 domain-containing protein [Steroidobacteraceae bacterium]
MSTGDTRRGGPLEGAWVPVQANVSGQQLIVGELRVKYLVFDGHDYSIIDRSNRIVDSGEYLVDDSVSPRTIDIVGRDGPNAGRSMMAIYQLEGDRLTVCYDLEGTERPSGTKPREDQLLLSITYERASGALS